jgi:plasmid stability protein
MPDILVRNLEPATVEELRARAKRNNRSVQAEVKSILEDATRSRAAAFERLVQHSDAIRNSLRGAHRGDSTDLIREDRDR